ncbi:MAG: alanine--glyoxylate aminotransferase family protein [Chloroflexota bacterium]
MSKDIFPSLFIPGPTNVPDDVLAAQTLPMVGHRTENFETLFAQIQEKLRALFFTQSRVYMLAASGSAFQEAAIRNGVQCKVINFVNGAFSNRWHDVSVGCDKDAIAVEVEWGKAVTPQIVLNALADHPDTEAITVVLNETSTGVCSPIGDIASAVRDANPNVLIFVDAVSGFAGVKIPFDEWRLDICLTSSQKALAVPPGLAFAAVSDRTLDKAKTVSGRGWYLDFINLEKYMLRNTTPATPAISLARAMNVQLDRIMQEGIEARFERHARLAARTRQWAIDQEFSLFAEAGYESPTVTTIGNARGVDIGAMLKTMNEQGFAFSNGYGHLKGKGFRIAHMGDVTDQEMDTALATLTTYLETL